MTIESRLHVVPIVALTSMASALGATKSQSPWLAPLVAVALLCMMLILTRVGVTAIRQNALALSALIVAYPAILPRGMQSQTEGGQAMGLDQRQKVQLAIIFTILLLATWLCIATRDLISVLRVAPMPHLVIYSTLVLFSLTYTPDKEWATYAAARLLGAVLLITVLMKVITTPKQVQAVIFLMMTAASFVLLIFWVEVIQQGGIQGERAGTSWLTPVNASLIGAMIAVVAVAALLSSNSLEHPFVTIAAALFGGVSSALASSKSSVGALIVALLIVATCTLFKRTNYSVGMRLLPMTLGLIIGMYYMIMKNFGIVAHLNSYQNSEYIDPTNLTGRTDVWAIAIRDTLSDPITSILGHGYMSTFAIGLETEHFFNGTRIVWNAPTAHNSFIQTFFDLGLLGLLVVGTLYLGAWRQIVRQAVTFSASTLSWSVSVQLLASMTLLTIVSFVEDVFGGIFEIRSMFFLVTVFAIYHNGRLAVNAEKSRQSER